MRVTHFPSHFPIAIVGTPLATMMEERPSSSHGGAREVSWREKLGVKLVARPPVARRSGCKLVRDHQQMLHVVPRGRALPPSHTARMPCVYYIVLYSNDFMYIIHRFLASTLRLVLYISLALII